MLVVNIKVMLGLTHVQHNRLVGLVKASICDILGQKNKRKIVGLNALISASTGGGPNPSLLLCRCSFLIRGEG